jgi:hypothetical protein
MSPLCAHVLAGIGEADQEERGVLAFLDGPARLVVPVLAEVDAAVVLVACRCIEPPREQALQLVQLHLLEVGNLLGEELLHVAGPIDFERRQNVGNDAPLRRVGEQRVELRHGRFLDALVELGHLVGVEAQGQHEDGDLVARLSAVLVVPLDRLRHLLLGNFFDIGEGNLDERRERVVALSLRERRAYISRSEMATWARHALL